jgi:serine/threonine-protein kinase
MPFRSPTPTECPPEALFVALLDGELAAPDAALLRRHAEACRACRTLLDELPKAGTSDPIADALLHGATTAADETARTPPPGQIIAASYRLLRLLGSGGMGSVYEAEHVVTGGRFAVKVIKSRLLALGSDARSRFQREGRAAAAVESPRIARIIDSGVDEATSHPYLVMELLRGEDLQKLLHRTGPLRPDTALRIAVQALEGLADAHAAGVVHRDIKPANLFLARGDDGAVTVKLVDFGIAKMAPDPLLVSESTGLTHTGGLLGSPLYMSPEQVQNSKGVDHRADLWSLGSTLYAALAGRAPHRDAESVGQLILAICSTEARPLRELAPWVRPELAAAVHRALAIDPAGRYPSAAAMLAALRPLVSRGFALREEMLAGITPEERTAVPLVPPSAGARAGRAAAASTASWSRLLLGAVAVLGIAVAAHSLARTPGPAPPSSTAAPRDPSAPTAEPFPRAALAAPEPVRRVTLVVLPEDASVEVDGVPAKVQNGAVEIDGALGSEHGVRVFKGEGQVSTSVTVTETGAAPPKVALVPRRAAAAVPKPPPASAGTAPAKPSRARLEEELRKPE